MANENLDARKALAILMFVALVYSQSTLLVFIPAATIFLALAIMFMNSLRNQGTPLITRIACRARGVVVREHGRGAVPAARGHSRGQGVLSRRTAALREISAQPGVVKPERGNTRGSSEGAGIAFEKSGAKTEGKICAHFSPLVFARESRC